MKVRRVDFSPDEWIAGCVGLDNACRGLYITACALMYSAGGPIRVEHLRNACTDHGHAFKRQFGILVSLGKLIVNEGQIANKRALNELQNANKRTVNWRQNGAKGGRPSNKTNDITKPKGFISTRAQVPINHQPSTNSVASATGAEAPSDDPVKELFDRGLKILGMAQRALLGKFRKRHGDVVVLEAICACEREHPSDPAAYFVRCCEAHAGKSQRQSPATTLWEGAYHATLKWEQSERDRRDGGESDEPLLGRGRSPVLP